MSHRILIVEDNAFNREMLCDWLDLRGFQVKTASNLNEAFASIEQKLPELVLLDVQLGAEDGLSLAKHMRQDQNFQHVPIVAVTAHAMLVEQERILRAGCNACISKPVDFRLLEEQLHRWLALGSDKAACLPARN